LGVRGNARHPQEDRLALRLQIELVFDPGCPHLGDAREVLAAACREVGAPAVWTEWNSEDPECPEYARNLGSPTVLVNGEDVAPGPRPWVPREAGDDPRRRMYRDGDSIVPVPPKGRIARAIGAALGPAVG
jgi:hypothetical protein